MTEQASEVPPIELTFDRMFCAIHGEPFREQWPRGAIIFQLEAIKTLLHDEPTWKEVMRIAGLDPDSGAKVEPKWIEAALDKRPACCRLGARLLEHYELQHKQGGIGTKGFCAGCGGFALGAPYRNRQPDGSVDRVPHVCFRCVATRIVPRSS